MSVIHKTEMLSAESLTLAHATAPPTHLTFALFTDDCGWGRPHLNGDPRKRTLTVSAVDDVFIPLHAPRAEDLLYDVNLRHPGRGHAGKE